MTGKLWVLRRGCLLLGAVAALTLVLSNCSKDSNSGGGNNNNGNNNNNNTNPGDPTCTITGPGDGTSQAFDSDWTFTATATDTEDGTLTGPSIQWLSDVIGALGNGNSLTMVLNPPYTHQITCIATDSDGNTGSDTITVNAISPVVEIWHPGDGEPRDPCPTNIPFTGNARDFEDGNISANITWASNLDGALNSGNPSNNFSDCLTTSGPNLVTATIVDADQNSASAVITLNVQ